MKKYNINDFWKKAEKVHNNKYNYSKVEYNGASEKVCIICPEHGEFWQRPDKHVHGGQGCPICGGTKKLTTNEFIERAKQVHGDKYNYSKVNYNGNDKKVCIICPEHGEFWQTPHAHLLGQGCPYCKKILLEIEVKNFLDKNNIKFEQQKSFIWLKNKKTLFLDFYLPDYSIGIECQGIQHYEPVEFFGGIRKFKEQILNDEIKKQLCSKHGITILYYTKNNDNHITNLSDLKYKIYENKLQ